MTQDLKSEELQGTAQHITSSAGMKKSQLTSFHHKCT